jgi:NAD(P)-dependent dehydrogenase (short-subunit alcohol dehydrogenase family)
MNVIVTGTSRGIGLELTHIALTEGHNVCAVARNPKKSLGLQKLVSEFGSKIQCLELDVTDKSAAQKILDATKTWPAIDVLINNAGVFEKEMTEEALIQSFRVNSIAPLLLTQALLPQLKKSSQPTVIQITSKMGSIDDNTSGSYYAYRASKTALNMFNKSLANDNPWLNALVVHPGWVQTDMGGDGAPTPTAESASGIWKIAIAKNKVKTGSFFDFKGQEIKW